MEFLVWAGAVLTLLGLAGIVYSLVAVLRLRRAKVDDATLRDRMGRIVPINLGAFFCSFLGLTLVVTGVILS